MTAVIAVLAALLGVILGRVGEAARRGSVVTRLRLLMHSHAELGRRVQELTREVADLSRRVATLESEAMWTRQELTRIGLEHPGAVRWEGRQ